MKIDIKKAKEAFREYVKNFDPEDEKIKLKIAHIEIVSQIAKRIAVQQNLSEEDIQLAELIGLLHDIGRFEQASVYHTFVDRDSINHGEYGVKVLFEDGLMRNFIETDEFDEIIKLSILNHNRAKIQDGLTEKQNLHARIIRDADKIDLFAILTVGDKKAIWEKADLSNDIITDEIYREFTQDMVIDYKNRETSADILVSHFAYVYDFNFKESLKIIKENGYLEKLYKRFTFKDEKTMEKYNEIYRIAKKYLEEKG